MLDVASILALMIANRPLIEGEFRPVEGLDSHYVSLEQAHPEAVEAQFFFSIQLEGKEYFIFMF